MLPAVVQEQHAPKKRWRALLATITTAMVAIMGLTVPAVAQADDTAGLTLTVDYGTEQYNGTAVVAPNTDYTATLSYYAPSIVPGSSVIINIPEGVDFPSVPPSDNTIIESITKTAGNTLTVKFFDELDPTVNQGELEMKFRFTTTETQSEKRNLVWTVGETVTTDEVIIKTPGSIFQPALTTKHTKAAKGTNPGLNTFIAVSSTREVTLKPGIENVKVPYEIVVDSTAARTFTLNDAISNYMTVDTSSFKATLTTWGTDGLNQSTAPFVLPPASADGQTVTVSDISVPENSRLQITYTAGVKPTELKAELQKKATATTDANGNFTLDLNNTATIGSQKSAAKVTLAGKVPAPGRGGSIGKDLASADTYNLKRDADGQIFNMATGEKMPVDADGNFVTPIPVSYKVTSSLRPWDAFKNDPAFGLTQNAILTDTLPNSSMAWNIGDTLSAEVTTFAPAPANTSTKATVVFTRAVGGTPENPTELTNAEFRSDQYVNTYRLSADKKRIDINIGKNTLNAFSFALPAEIKNFKTFAKTNAADLKNLPQLEARYTAQNQAWLTYQPTGGNYVLTGDSRATAKMQTINVEKPAGQEIVDATEFKKTSVPLEQQKAGAAFQVPFNFFVAAGAVSDLRTSQIIDTVDVTSFDMSNIEAIKSKITGKYDGAAGLTGSDFDVTFDTENNLIIVPSATFGANLPAANIPAADSVLNKKLEFTLFLPSYASNAKSTVITKNSARLASSQIETDFMWASSTDVFASSFGRQIEVQKSVRTVGGEPTTGLRAPIVDGKLTNDEFIYELTVIAHGGSNNFIPIRDLVPESMEILGLVEPSQLEAGATTTSKTLDLKNNLRVRYDDANSTIFIETSGANKKVEKNVIGKAYFKIRLKDNFTENVAISNNFGGAKASITPSSGFPLNIEKLDIADQDAATEDEKTVITDLKSRFTITAPNGTVVTDDAYVVNGKLVTGDRENDHKAIVIPADPEDPAAVPSGDYKVEEKIAPEGYRLDTEPKFATIQPNGNSDALKFYNTKKDLFAIGDYVWIDENKDGIQNENAPLAGVTVELLDENNKVLNTTTTDDKGFYLFDELPEGTYKVKFALTEAQKALYKFTAPTVTTDGATVANDSDADPETGLTAEVVLMAGADNIVPSAEYGSDVVKAGQGINPTLDAGLIKKTYAIGDYVWIDENRDGLQSADVEAEKTGLADVTVELLNADETPVTNADGSPVVTTTDAAGRYLFDELAAGSYKVRFTLSPEDSARFIFTKLTDAPASNNPAELERTDSNAIVNEEEPYTALTETITLGEGNTHLTGDYDRAFNATEGVDPTWDAGVIRSFVTVGNYVWHDRNNDGIQNDDIIAEGGAVTTAGIANVLVKITGPDGNPVTDINGVEVAPVRTNTTGGYEFTNLPVLPVVVDGAPAAAYTVSIVPEESADALKGMKPAKTGAGTTATDSSSGSASSTGLTKNGEKDLTLDFGFVGVVSVGNYVWNDRNNDGIQNDDIVDADGNVIESAGIGDVVLNLTGPDGNPVTDVDGNPVEPVATGADGSYNFPNLPALQGNQVYTVTIDVEKSQGALENLHPAKTGAGDRSTDSSTGFETAPGLTYPGAIDDTLDFGFVGSVSVGNYVWEDINNDGVQNDDIVDENGNVTKSAGFEGVELTLTGPDGEPVVDVFGDPVLPVLTDARGFYEFVNLPALVGDQAYTVTLTEKQQLLERYVPAKTSIGTTDTDSSTGSAAAAGLTYPGAQDLTLDFGFVGTVAVSDFVWFDENEDGLQTPNEPGIPGVVLTLVGPDGEPVVDVFGNPVLPVATNDDGLYAFTQLPVLLEGEDYTVLIDRESSAKALESLKPTTTDAGNRASDSSSWSATSEGLTVSGEFDPTLDFGFVPEDAVIALSKTGSDNSALLLGGGIAGGLLLLGAGVLLVARRKKAQNV